MRIGLTMVITWAAPVVVMVIMVPAIVGEYDATAQGQQGQQGNQQSDSTQHLKILMVNAAMKPNLFIGCNMRPRSQRVIPGKR